MAIKYEDIDGLSEDQMREVLGMSSEGMTADKMRARIKGAMRAQEESVDEPLPVAENEIDEVATEEVKTEEVKTEPEAPRADGSILVSREEFEALKADMNEIRRENRELKANITSRSKMSRRAKDEEQHTRARISEYYRDVLAEYRIYKTTGVTKQVVIKRPFQIDQEAFKNGRFIPCAMNGGMYYLRNPSWKPNPRTGEIRGPIIWNRHLYVDYTIKGNKDMLLREDFKLCDWRGKDVKSFMEEMPIEDLEIVRKKARDAEKARMSGSGVAEALHKLMNT